MGAIVHTLHVILAGVWLGGVVFTTLVVSPALKAMKWSEAYRVMVRSAIGKRYAKVATANLVLLLLFAVVDGAFIGFGAWLYAEYALLILLFGLVTAHAPAQQELAWALRRSSWRPVARWDLFAAKLILSDCHLLCQSLLSRRWASFVSSRKLQSP